MQGRYEQRVVKILVTEYPRDQSIGELTKKTGMSRDTVRKYIRKLSAKGLVEESRTVGRAKLYQPSVEILEFLQSPEREEDLHDFIQLKE